ncbi:MAG: hypothetical protein V3W41_05815 [Planctomycetota bacterium]
MTTRLSPILLLAFAFICTAPLQAQFVFSFAPNADWTGDGIIDSVSSSPATGYTVTDAVSGNIVFNLDALVDPNFFAGISDTVVDLNGLVPLVTGIRIASAETDGSFTIIGGFVFQEKISTQLVIDPLTGNNLVEDITSIFSTLPGLGAFLPSLPDAPIAPVINTATSPNVDFPLLLTPARLLAQGLNPLAPITIAVISPALSQQSLSVLGEDVFIQWWDIQCIEPQLVSPQGHLSFEALFDDPALSGITFGIQILQGESDGSLHSSNGLEIAF